ncbi:MAG: ribosome silencing factor [Spirochaetaceae bacterium]|jgi:ribosome-associated protein|nr:ribosome silencing factor [Spirochaetaceae bacterium]
MDGLLKSLDAAADERPHGDDEWAYVRKIGALLAEHHGGNVAVIDLRPFSMWTDFFIVATVTSGAHLAGLKRRIKEFAQEHDLAILNSRRKGARGDEWDIVDMGSLIIHLMTEKARDFYELEHLWSDGRAIHIKE